MIDKYEIETDKQIIEQVTKKANFLITNRIRKRGEEFRVYTSSGDYLIDTKTGIVKRRID